jgi:hypothetical protein
VRFYLVLCGAGASYRSLIESSISEKFPHY